MSTKIEGKKKEIPASIYSKLVDEYYEKVEEIDKVKVDRDGFILFTKSYKYLGTKGRRVLVVKHFPRTQ